MWGSIIVYMFHVIYASVVCVCWVCVVCVYGKFL